MSLPKYLLIILCVLSVLSLKKSQVGVDDWNIRTVGLISDISFLNPTKIVALSQGKISTINKTSGVVIDRINVHQNSSILKVGGRGALRQVYASQENTLTRMSLVKDQQTILCTTKGRVVEYLILGSASVVISEQSVGVIKGKAVEQKQTIKQRKYVHAFKTGQNEFVLVSEGQTDFCVHKVTLSGQIMEEKSETCHSSVSNTFFKQFAIIDSKASSVIMGMVEGKVLASVPGTLYKVLPASRVLIFKTQQGGYIKYDLEQNTQQAIEIKSFIEENSKGKLFTIQTERSGQYTLNVLGEGRFRWSSTSKQIMSAWLHAALEQEYQLVVQYNDLRVEYFNFGSSSKTVLTPVWSREESLSLVTNTLFLDFQNEKELSNDYYQTLLHDYNSYNVLPLYLRRIQIEIRDLLEGSKTLLRNMVYVIANINIGNLFKGKDFVKFPSSDAYEKQIGMRKIVLAATSNGFLFGIDSKTSLPLWKSQIGLDTSNANFFRIISEQTQRVLVSVYNHKEHTLRLLQVDWKTGVHSVIKTFQAQKQPVVFQVTESRLGVKHADRIQYFGLDQEQQNKHTFTFYNIQHSDVFCQSVAQNGSLEQTWRMSLPQEEEVVSSVTSFRGDKQSKLPLFKQNMVYLKNVDYTNFAIITKTRNSKILNLYVLNGQNGHVLLHKHKRNVDFDKKINLVYDQNSILVSYFNSLNKMYEVWVVEQYKDKVYTSVWEIIRQYFKKGANEDEDNSHHKTKNNLMVFESVFGSPLSIKVLKVSTSRLSLIKRNVYIITQQNQIYAIDRRFLTTRRPSSQSPIENQKYPPHDYLLPVSPTGFLSYNLNLNSLSNIEFSPTVLESTFLLLAYGQDLFLTRCSPDGTFDMITNDFNYPFIALVIVLATLTLQVIKRKVKRSKISKSFK